MIDSLAVLSDEPCLVGAVRLLILIRLHQPRATRQHLSDLRVRDSRKERNEKTTYTWKGIKEQQKRKKREDNIHMERNKGKKDKKGCPTMKKRNQQTMKKEQRPRTSVDISLNRSRASM